MKNLILLALVSISFTTAMAQNGKIIKDDNAQTRNLKGFHGIRVSGGIDLYLSQGPEAIAVSASTPEYREKIQTVIENGILKIYLKNTGAHLILGFKNPKLKAYVSATSLDLLGASGGSDVFIDGVLSSNKLDINISGGSDITGKLDVKELSLDQSGGSDADIAGKAETLKVEASGGSDLKAYNLIADFCDIVASGGSDAEVTVNKELSAHASGGSDIFYQGSGTIRDLRSSGSSSVKKRG
ncbi:MAG: head GIN domain-containing protein [Chitinophagales bacterium]